MHGGIGRSINHVEQIENIQRPITMEAGSIILMDLLWLVSVFSFSYVVTFDYLPLPYITCVHLGLIQRKMIALKG